MKRTIKSFISQYILCTVPEEHAESFYSDLRQTNYRRMCFMAVFVFIENLFANFVIGSTAASSASGSFLSNFFFVKLGVLGLFLLFFFAFWERGLYKKPAGQVFSHLFLFCFMLFEVIYTVLELHTGGPVYGFLFALTLAAVLPLLTLRSSLFHLGLSSVIMIALTIAGTQSVGAFRTNLIYTVFFALLAFTISRVFYYVHFKNFLDDKRLSSVNSELETLVEKLERLSVTDELTGINNRRRLMNLMEIVFEECKREQKPISMLMVDIDKFKPYNDNYGHLQGDRCLIRVAAAFAPCFKRVSDIVARYGGEEFVVVLPFVGQDKAAELAEQYRSYVESLAIPHEFSSVADVVTVSVGVSTCIPEISERATNLLNCADEAMYEAKQQGSNRVVVKPLYPPKPLPINGKTNGA
ncbi:GGDEF domain-containing protein [Oscillospiraceae bacterium OttesenSCG-928-G22]|nr:GGDEF domain-containing protein [Oscillospiraceae bacterium OttesenSCG-928-G22]